MSTQLNAYMINMCCMLLDSVHQCFIIVYLKLLVRRLEKLTLCLAFAIPVKYSSIVIGFNWAVSHRRSRLTQVRFKEWKSWNNQWLCAKSFQTFSCFHFQIHSLIRRKVVIEGYQIVRQIWVAWFPQISSAMEQCLVCTAHAHKHLYLLFISCC